MSRRGGLRHGGWSNILIIDLVVHPSCALKTSRKHVHTHTHTCIYTSVQTHNQIYRGTGTLHNPNIHIIQTLLRRVNDPCRNTDNRRLLVINDRGVKENFHRSKSYDRKINGSKFSLPSYRTLHSGLKTKSNRKPFLRFRVHGDPLLKL